MIEELSNGEEEEIKGLRETIVELERENAHIKNARVTGGRSRERA